MTEEQRKEFFAMRKALDGYVSKIVDSPAEINENPAAIRPWKPGVYVIGDVRMYEDIPHKCVQAHDSTLNEAWTPAVASLWMQYHGTSKETARPWIAPTGAHDAYQSGEFAIYNGSIYECMMDGNVFSPDTHPAGWKKV